MDIKEALKAKTITGAELKVISRNIHLLSEKDAERLGLEKERAKALNISVKAVAKKVTK